MSRVFAFIAFGFCASALAQQATRAWEFELHSGGAYKVQVEHPVKEAIPGTKVKYSITVGTETRARELDLIANRPFIPLVIEVARPEKIRVAVSGLAGPALRQTRAYVYNVDHVPYGEYFDPAKSPGFEDLAQIRSILTRPSEEIDLARTKLTVDKLVNPAIDIDATIRQIDAMVAKIRAMPELGATPTSKAIALQRFIYAAGAWNDNRPFEYDLDDPLGANPHNKLLTTYLSSRKGNCVTMPFLFIILGQRLGIDVTASTAPNHLLVKFRNELGIWINLEATSGANPAREVWIRQQSPTITDRAMENGIYLQPLTKKETAAVMAGLLAEHYFKREQYQRAIAAADLLLEYYAKDVTMMTLKGASYGRLVRKYFAERLASPRQTPPAPTWYYEHLSRSNHLWFAKAEALGWREETKEEKQKYIEHIKDTR